MPVRLGMRGVAVALMVAGCALALVVSSANAIDITLGERGAASRVRLSSGPHHFTVFSPPTTVTSRPLPPRALEIAEEHKRPRTLAPPPKHPKRHALLETAADVVDAEAAADADALLTDADAVDAVAVDAEADADAFADDSALIETGLQLDTEADAEQRRRGGKAKAKAKAARDDARPLPRADLMPRAPGQLLSRVKFSRKRAYTTHNTFALTYRFKPEKAKRKVAKGKGKRRARRGKGARSKAMFLEMASGDDAALIELQRKRTRAVKAKAKKHAKSKKSKERVVFLIESSKPYLPYFGPPVPKRRYIPTLAERAAAEKARRALMKTLGVKKAKAVSDAKARREQRVRDRAAEQKKRDAEAAARAKARADAAAAEQKAREPIIAKMAEELHLPRDQVMAKIAALDMFGDKKKAAAAAAEEAKIKADFAAADKAAEKKARAADAAAIKAAGTPPKADAATAAAPASASAAATSGSASASATVPAAASTAAASAGAKAAPAAAAAAAAPHNELMSGNPGAGPTSANGASAGAAASASAGTSAAASASSSAAAATDATAAAKKHAAGAGAGAAAAAGAKVRGKNRGGKGKGKGKGKGQGKGRKRQPKPEPKTPEDKAAAMHAQGEKAEAQRAAQRDAHAKQRADNAAKVARQPLEQENRELRARIAALMNRLGLAEKHAAQVAGRLPKSSAAASAAATGQGKDAKGKGKAATGKAANGKGKGKGKEKAAKGAKGKSKAKGKGAKGAKAKGKTKGSKSAKGKGKGKGEGKGKGKGKKDKRKKLVEALKKAEADADAGKTVDWAKVPVDWAKLPKCRLLTAKDKKALAAWQTMKCTGKGDAKKCRAAKKAKAKGPAQDLDGFVKTCTKPDGTEPELFSAADAKGGKEQETGKNGKAVKSEAQKDREDASGKAEKVRVRSRDPDDKQQPPKCRWVKRYKKACKGKGKSKTCTQKICSRKLPHVKAVKQKAKVKAKDLKAKADAKGKGKGKGKDAKPAVPRTKCVLRTCTGPGAGLKRPDPKAKATANAKGNAKDGKAKAKAIDYSRVCKSEPLLSAEDRKELKAKRAAQAKATRHALKQRLLREIMRGQKQPLSRRQKRRNERLLRRALRKHDAKHTRRLRPCKKGDRKCRRQRRKQRAERRRRRRARRARGRAAAEMNQSEWFANPSAPPKRIRSWAETQELAHESRAAYEERMAQQRADDKEAAEEELARRQARKQADEDERLQHLAELRKAQEHMAEANKKAAPQFHPVPVPPPVLQMDMDALRKQLAEGPPTARPQLRLPDDEPAHPKPVPTTLPVTKPGTPPPPAPASAPAPAPTPAATAAAAGSNAAAATLSAAAAPAAVPAAATAATPKSAALLQVDDSFDAEEDGIFLQTDAWGAATAAADQGVAISSELALRASSFLRGPDGSCYDGSSIVATLSDEQHELLQFDATDAHVQADGDGMRFVAAAANAEAAAEADADADAAADTDLESADALAAADTDEDGMGESMAVYDSDESEADAEEDAELDEEADAAGENFFETDADDEEEVSDEDIAQTVAASAAEVDSEADLGADAATDDELVDAHDMPIATSLVAADSAAHSTAAPAVVASPETEALFAAMRERAAEMEEQRRRYGAAPAPTANAQRPEAAHGDNGAYVSADTPLPTYSPDLLAPNANGAYVSNSEPLPIVSLAATSARTYVPPPTSAYVTRSEADIAEDALLLGSTAAPRADANGLYVFLQTDEQLRAAGEAEAAADAQAEAEAAVAVSMAMGVDGSLEFEAAEREAERADDALESQFDAQDVAEDAQAVADADGEVVFADDSEGAVEAAADDSVEADADSDSDAEHESEAHAEASLESDEVSDFARQREREEVQKRRFSGRIHMLRANVTGTIRTRTPHLVLGGVNQWVLVAHDHFSSKHQKRRGWSDERRSTCGVGSKDWFLGGPGTFGNHRVTKTFHRLPVHTHLRLTARFHFFDKWEGQYAYAMINDQVVWVQNHRHCTSIFASTCKGIDVCGDASYADRLSTAIDATVVHDNRHRHPSLPPIEMRVLGLAHDRAPAAAAANRKRAAALAAHAKAVAAAKAAHKPLPPAPALPATPLVAGAPGATTDPAATNRFADVEADDDGLSLAGEPLPPKQATAKSGAKVVAAPGTPVVQDIVFPLPNFNNTDTVTVTFGAVMPFVDASTASWGVDDVQLYVMVKHDWQDA